MELLSPNAEESVIETTTTDDFSPFKISKEDAIKELIATLNVFDNQDMRSILKERERIRQLENLNPDEIISVHYPQANQTKSDSQPTTDVLYLVNFKDSCGYAVLSADNRIPETVLAIIDRGSVDEGSFNSSEFLMTEEERREEIENFKYYDEEENDVYVGIPVGDSDGQNSSNHILMRYALNEIDNPNNEEPSNYTPLDHTITSEWTMKEEVPALLDTKWHQNSPFNDLCPERRKYILFGPKKIAPAGCVAVATAQILAYHEYPSVISSSGITINWKEAKKVWNYDPDNRSTDPYNQLMCATIMSYIGNNVNILYGYSSSMGLPSKVKKYLTNLGYENVHKYFGKNEAKIMSMLRKKNPVFMAGASGLGGHAWVVDGFRIKTRKIETISGRTGEVINTKEEEQTLLHCNWGWRGVSDGYYISGIFNTEKQPEEFDTKDCNQQTVGDDNYNYMFSVITYDLNK